MLQGLADQFQIPAALALARLVRDRAAITFLAAADIFAFQSDRLYRLPAAAFARITFAAFATALCAASAENSRSFLYGQNMHSNQVMAALALTRLVGNKIALAVVLAVAYIINVAFVGRDKHSDNRKQKQRANRRDDRSLHTELLLPAKYMMKRNCSDSFYSTVR